MKKPKFKRVSDIIPLLNDNQMAVASGMIQDAQFMEDQLAVLRKAVIENGASEQYQYGSKPTAEMETYLKMQKQYGVTIRYLTDLVVQSSKAEQGDELTAFMNSH